MNQVLISDSRVAVSWDAAVEGLGLAAVAAMLEDQAALLAEAMFDGKYSGLTRQVYQGLPIIVPALEGEGARIVVAAPGEGEGLRLNSLLAGLALTAHATEYLYFGSNPRFATAQKVKAYKYLVQAEALRCAADLLPNQFDDYEELLGLSW